MANAGNLTVIGDADPLLDVCSSPTGDKVTIQDATSATC